MLLILSAILVGATNAATIRLDFTVGNFTSGNGNPPPTNFISGSILWEALGVRNPVLSFDSISLSIDGHNYTTSEIDYGENAPLPGLEVIGCKLNGITTIKSQTDDFWIRWYQNTLTPLDFIFSSSHVFDIWSAYKPGFTSFSISEVPEPSSVFLLFFAGGFIGALQFKRKGVSEHHAGK